MAFRKILGKQHVVQIVNQNVVSKKCDVCLNNLNISPKEIIHSFIRLVDTH